MSVIFACHNFSFIDHKSYVNNLYKTVLDFEKHIQCFEMNPKLFCIKCVKSSLNRKRKYEAEFTLEEVSTIKQMYEIFLKEMPVELIKSSLSLEYNSTDTEKIRDLSRHLFECTLFDHIGINGGNDAVTPLKCKIQGEEFLIPQNCRFFCGDIKEQCLKLNKSKFDIVIADPPWWNKFIRRLKKANSKLSYKMMFNEDIAALPVKELLSSNSLVAVWCTNSPSSIAAVKDMIFPAWGVTYLTTWYWMKVSIDLNPFCDFGTGHMKQPYERLILGRVGQLKKNPEKHMFMSVPSALHSHKPPLLDLLSPYVDTPNPQVLELFARYLLPQTTSVGFEPLKWQHTSLYELVS